MVDCIKYLGEIKKLAAANLFVINCRVQVLHNVKNSLFGRVAFPKAILVFT